MAPSPISTPSSAVTIAGASGISLVDPSDSGLSLDEPVELSGDSESLELGEDDMLTLPEESDEGLDEMPGDDDFLLTPLDEADDDVLVDPDWIAEYAKAAADWPEATFFGGTIEPWWSVSPPAWVKKHLHRLDAPFAIRRLGDDTRRIDPGDELPYGASMAMRKSAMNRWPR